MMGKISKQNHRAPAIIGNSAYMAATDCKGIIC